MDCLLTETGESDDDGVYVHNGYVLKVPNGKEIKVIA